MLPSYITSLPHFPIPLLPPPSFSLQSSLSPRSTSLLSEKRRPPRNSTQKGITYYIIRPGPCHHIAAGRGNPAGGRDLTSRQKSQRLPVLPLVGTPQEYQATHHSIYAEDLGQNSVSPHESWLVDAVVRVLVVSLTHPSASSNPSSPFSPGLPKLHHMLGRGPRICFHQSGRSLSGFFDNEWFC